MVGKGPGMIADEVRTALKVAACDLNLKKWDRMHIVSDVCDGVIETNWGTYTVGGRSGVLFRTQLSSDKGDYKVNFLLSSDDLERGAELLREMEEKKGGNWNESSTRFPVEELYQFYDLSTARAQKSKLN